MQHLQQRINQSFTCRVTAADIEHKLDNTKHTSYKKKSLDFQGTKKKTLRNKIPAINKNLDTKKQRKPNFPYKSFCSTCIGPL